MHIQQMHFHHRSHTAHLCAVQLKRAQRCWLRQNSRAQGQAHPEQQPFLSGSRQPLAAAVDLHHNHARIGVGRGSGNGKDLAVVVFSHFNCSPGAAKRYAFVTGLATAPAGARPSASRRRADTACPASACSGRRAALERAGGGCVDRLAVDLHPLAHRGQTLDARPESGLRSLADVQQIVAALAGAVDQVADERLGRFQFWSCLL